MSGTLIERGSPEHLRAVVEVHQDTLRMVNRMAANVRKALEVGEVEIARTELDAIKTLTSGPAGDPAACRERRARELGSLLPAWPLDVVRSKA